MVQMGDRDAGRMNEPAVAEILSGVSQKHLGGRLRKGVVQAIDFGQQREIRSPQAPAKTCSTRAAERRERLNIVVPRDELGEVLA